MTDLALIQTLRDGKTDKALASLYRHLPMVRKMIRQSGGNRQDAEDTFQEALIIFLRRAASPDFTLTAQISTYLYSVARHIWNEECRRRKRQQTQSADSDAPGFPPSGDAPHPPGLHAIDTEALEKEAIASLAEQALNQLGDRCKQLLLRFYIDQQSLREIAAKMGYGSENAAKTQKYKCLEGAKAKLRTLKTALPTR